MKITKTQLKKMIQETVRKQLNESERWVYKTDYAEHILQHMDESTFLRELIDAMDSREAKENFDWIVRMHDLPEFGEEVDEYPGGRNVYTDD